MANHISHAALPFPVKGCRYTILVPYLDGTGTPTDPTTPDTERSIDAGSFADCTEEVATITGSNGMGYLTLTGDELNCSALAVCAKVASGPKATLATLYPRVLPVLFSGTATAGAAGTITLSATAPPPSDKLVVGCIIRTTGGTGGAGGSGSLGNQARVITGYVASTRVVTVTPNWETTPDNTTTYEILLTEMSLLRYADVQEVLGTLVTAATAGILDVNAKNINNATAPTLTGDAYARLGAPAGASVSADVAAVKTDTAAVKTKTDQLVFTTANKVDARAFTVDDKTGYALSSTGLDAVAAPADITSDANARSSFIKMIRALFNRFYNRVEQTATEQTLFNDADSAIITMDVDVTGSGAGRTQIKEKSA